jgi:hypothetical protein
MHGSLLSEKLVNYRAQSTNTRAWVTAMTLHSQFVCIFTYVASEQAKQVAGSAEKWNGVPTTACLKAPSKGKAASAMGTPHPPGRLSQQLADLDGTGHSSPPPCQPTECEEALPSQHQTATPAHDRYNMQPRCHPGPDMLPP